MNKTLVIFVLSLISFRVSFSQGTFPVNGVKDNKSQIYYAFTNAIIAVDYQTIITNATLLIKDGFIEQAGQNITLPKGTVVYDLKGRYIYPSLIDLYSNYGMPEVKKEKKGDGPQMESSTKGAYNWNQAIKPEITSSKQFNADSKTAGELRKLGFGAVLTHQQDGIARGTSVFVSLADGKDNEVMLKGEAAAHYSFSKGSSTQDYPSSVMGSIALLRQTYLDAEWYNKNQQANREYNLSLEEWNRIQKLPQVFEVDDKLSALRADKVGDEFSIQYIIKGNGDEYQRINEIKATKANLILPVNFPKAYDVEDAYDALLVSLEDIKHWELAPANLAAIEKNQIPFSITTAGLKEKKEFWKNLNKAIDNGLSRQEALKALTYSPAKMLGMENKTGSLKSGMMANFIITSDSLFSEKMIIYENWIQGRQYKIYDKDRVDIRGDYGLNIGTSIIYMLKVKGEIDKLTGEIIPADSVKSKVNIDQDGGVISLHFESEKDKGFIRLSGKINYNSGIWDGRGQLPNGDWIKWSAIKKAKFEAEKKDSTDKKKPDPGSITYPLMAYGWKEFPETENILIKGATVWTLENEGKIENADVLIREGKIAKVGHNIDTTGSKAKIIDGRGKHLTPGIIDEHSHIAISKGVNEGTQAVSSEVRIGDVVNSDDINIYRQLSGGVTAAQLLHGSANPIGGQSALIKLRWGRSPEEMKIEGADGYIKFALGENVKQANHGDKSIIRFPQTRMGVEQTFYDAFIRAKEYQLTWNKFNKPLAKGKEKTAYPRKDLELEALVEILNEKRFITCHSYVQSEINMLMHIADSMGFKINTFTHILEGYKVADKMKAHGVGSSTFADWWAYKFEVNDAIPYNAAMLNQMGIITAINSDDAEMGRRLNQEAAKTVKYGNVSEEDALKMVTLNAAKLLHLDNKMGSIKAGKDADLVLWSDHPLSIYAKAEKTFVDGICYFDREQDLILREEIRRERSRIIQKMIKAKKEGEETQKPKAKNQKLYHCETIEEETGN